VRWTPPSAMKRLPPVAALLLGLAALGCSSAGSKSSDSAGAAVLVTLRNFRSGERFELASESHTDRLAYYSDARGEAQRKVQSDEIMSAFVDELERQGYADHAQAGRAPSLEGSDVVRWGIEVEDGEQRTHWLVGTSSPPNDWNAFQKCRDTFLQLYNITVSFQAVQNKEAGKKYFDAQQTRPAGSPPR